MSAVFGSRAGDAAGGNPDLSTLCPPLEARLRLDLQLGIARYSPMRVPIGQLTRLLCLGTPLVEAPANGLTGAGKV